MANEFFKSDDLDMSAFPNTFTTLETHTVGEPTRIILSGFPAPEGNSIMECKEYYEANCDNYRQALMAEPRGHRDMVGALLLPPCDPAADIGVIYMDANRWINMCGHATIGCATAAVDCGFVLAKEPLTHVILDTPAGLVHTDVHVENGRAVSVSFKNVPSFLYIDDCSVILDGPDGGVTVNFAISYAGSFFALVDAEQLGVKICPAAVEDLRLFGMRLLKKINESICVKHPLLPIEGVANVEFYGPAATPASDQCNVVVSAEGQVDRSPCGTGTSAKLAYMYSTGRLSLDEEFVNENFTGAIFKGRVTKETSVGDYQAVIPEITGSAYICGRAEWLIDMSDPLKWGFVI